MGFFRQEYWSGLPFPSPGNIPDSGIKLASPVSVGGSLPLSHQGNPGKIVKKQKKKQNICNIRYVVKEQKAKKEGERNLGGC